MNFLASGMLRCSGNMYIPSILNILMCLLDIIFNFFLIFPKRQIEIMGLNIDIYGAGLGGKRRSIENSTAELVTAGGMMWYLCYRSPILKLSGERGHFLLRKIHYEMLSAYPFQWDLNI